MNPFKNLSDKQNAILKWSIITIAFILDLTALGLMIWGACILGISNAHHNGTYNDYVQGGLLTGLGAFVFIFIILNLSSYLSSHKELFNNLKQKFNRNKPKVIGDSEDE